MKTNLLFLFPLLIIFGCKINTKNKEVHPTKENTPPIENEIVNYINTSSNSINLPQGLVRINDFTNKIKIGKDYGSESEVFGFIRDVSIDIFKRIYILDERRQDITVFNKNGKYLTTLAGKGAGPGELEAATSLSIYKNKWLLIDNLYRIEIYDISKEKISFLKTVTIDRLIKSACIVEDKYYIYSPILTDEQKNSSKNQFPLVHVYDIPQFDYLFSFGNSYKDDKIPIINQLSLGELSCNKESNMVLFKFDRFNYLFGYSALDGSLIWSNIIDKMQIATVEESVKNGSIVLNFNSDGLEFRDRIMVAQSIDKDLSLLQIDRRYVPQSGALVSGSEVLSFIIDSNSGKTVYYGKSIPRILAISDSIYFSVDSDYVIGSILR